MKYTPKYFDEIKALQIKDEQVPHSLKTLIGKFEKAVKSFELADEKTKNILLPILVQSDAVISAEIYQLKPERAAMKFDKLKLLKLKAKAINLQTQTV